METVSSSIMFSTASRLYLTGGSGGIAEVCWTICILGSIDGPAKGETMAWYETRSSTLNVELIPKSKGRSIT